MQSLLVYGSTSTGKTTLCGQFARYQAALHNGRPCLYIGSDSGWYSAQDEIDDGVLIPYDLASHPDPLWALRRLARGFWPAQINPMGAAVNPQDFRTLADLKLDISGIAVEGMSRISELLSGTLSNDMQMDTQEPLTAKFRLRADGVVLQGTALQAMEGPNEESFSMASRGTYKFIQEQTLDYLNRFKSHPYAPRLLVTAHQGEGKTSEGIAARCLGPLVYGKALVDKAPGWFSSYFHVETIPQNKFFYTCPNNCNRHPQCPLCRGLGQIGSPEMRALWFRFHLDEAGSGLQWPSKLGTSPRLTHWFRQNFPQGYMPFINNAGLSVGGLVPFLQAFDQESQALRPQASFNRPTQLIS